MSTRTVRLSGFSLTFVLVLLLTSVLLGCDDESVGPEVRGTLEGTVESAETNAPIPRANVTTSPPTQSVLTNDNGTFRLEDIPTGNYTVNVSKNKFASRSVNVRVAENETTNASIVLQPEEGGGTDSLAADVTNWFNDRINEDGSGEDSVFVDAEFRAENVGEVEIRRYEVTFAIETAQDGTQRFQAEGDSLEVGESDIGNFRKLIQSDAETVEVEDTFWETKN